MGRRSAIGIVLVIGAVIGFVLLALAATTSFGDFHVVAKNWKAPAKVRKYECGSVLSPKDVRNLAPKTARKVSPYLLNAYKKCEAARSSRSHKASTYLVIGAILVIASLVIPAVMRSVRRRRHRPRRTYTV